MSALFVWHAAPACSAVKAVVCICAALVHDSEMHTDASQRGTPDRAFLYNVETGVQYFMHAGGAAVASSAAQTSSRASSSKNEHFE